MMFNTQKYPILTHINSVQHLRNLKKEILPAFCHELRQYFIDSVSYSSGHFASNLGVVELTVALHYVYNTPFDNLIWDIGHQAYLHKILTGRRDAIKTIRKKNGLHPFPSREESEFDICGVGHAATSISTGLGMAIASKKLNNKRATVCVIGDGALTAGMSFEAINHAGMIKPDLLVLLNDNSMSISENVGALKKYIKHFVSEKKSSFLNKIKKYCLKKLQLINISKNIFKKTTKSTSIFESLGFKYIGPIDGHDILKLIDILSNVKLLHGLNFLHVITKKGKGYVPAEKDPVLWHAVSKFDPISGTFCKEKNNFSSYSKIFGDFLCEIASFDKKLIAITPAMCEGSGMLEFSQKFPEQYFDVGIAEQHALTFAAGLSISGFHPVIAIYSTFLQRAYDQLIHDIAIQKLPILLALDRSGIVGPDGKTHQGIFDLSYLRCIPNILIMTPSDESECRNMLYTGYIYQNGPSVVRYPRGYGIGVKLTSLMNFPLGKGVKKRYGKCFAILNFGTLLQEAYIVAETLNASLVDMRFVKPLDETLILELTENHQYLITIEENVIKGGAGSGVNELLMLKNKSIPILNIGLPDLFIAHGSQEEIRHDFQLNFKGMINQINAWLKK